MKEFFRKQIVNLKRSPQNIPLVVLVVAFLVYSLNLTYISHTTSRIQGPGMLSFVCFFNSFPRRKKPNMPMLILMFVMFAIIIFADLKYRGLIHSALTRPDNPINPEVYIDRAYSTLMTHIIILCIGASLIVLMPVYSKALRSIKTSIEVEDNGSMGEIDISGED